VRRWSAFLNKLLYQFLTLLNVEFTKCHDSLTHNGLS
jgi:hypothetical protein